MKMYDHLKIVMSVLYVVDARVYCQDSNASPWMPLGFTCPVVCQNIVSAVERLKRMDFDNIINRHVSQMTTFNYKDVPLLDKGAISNKIDIEEAKIIDKDGHEKISRKSLNKIDNQNEDMKDFKNANGTIDEKQLYKDVTKIIQTASRNSGCTRYTRIGIVSKLKKCTRRLNYDKGFLRIMTKLLNTYVKTKYKFTDDMTEVLLEKILGKNTDLRHDILDVNNLLTYLRAAMHRHKEHEHPDKISLKSKRCLTISLPGCFCRSGFVESYGQCVKPSDCVDESIQAYLSRVVVL